jgi:hypothetical protein
MKTVSNAPQAPSVTFPTILDMQALMHAHAPQDLVPRILEQAKQAVVTTPAAVLHVQTPRFSTQQTGSWV